MATRNRRSEKMNFSIESGIIKIILEMTIMIKRIEREDFPIEYD